MAEYPSRRIVLGAASLLTAAAAGRASAAAVHTLKVGEALPRFTLLKPGTHRYLRARASGDSVTPTDLWTRTVSFEPREGRTALRIIQRWEAPSQTLHLDSWFEPGTFRPFTHDRTLRKGEESRLESFDFRPDGVVGRAGVASNTREGFRQATPEPFYNFEVDMEFLQTLRLAQGYEVSVPFYHPGAEGAERTLFKVVGRERLPAPGGLDLDCWVVTTDYGKPGPLSRFWLARSGQQLVRIESPRPDGTRILKMLLL